MTTFTDWINALDSFVWGPAMLVLILGTGLYLQVRLGGMPVRKIGAGLRLVWSGRGGDEAHGEVSPYAALMTCLAATIGVGNIAGVATAIAMGGPGALFWMWMIAFLGAGSAYIESASGIGEGARTGVASLVTGALFLLAMFFAPLVTVIPYEAATPALVVVGFLMMTQIRHIDFMDYSIGIPAFLTIALMPFTYSIATGIGAGFVSWTVIQIFTGKAKQIGPIGPVAMNKDNQAFRLPRKCCLAAESKNSAHLMPSRAFVSA